MEKAYNMLFVCTGNSARSIIAEGIANHLGRGRFKAYSAGSHPKGAVHPMALEVLAAMRLPTDGYRSKSWEEFAEPSAPQLDFVFTVCDQAAGEVCPVWPGQPMTAHWGVPDPAAVVGDADLQRRAFQNVLLVLRRRIELLFALPLPRLDRLAIQREIQEIGKRE